MEDGQHQFSRRGRRGIRVVAGVVGKGPRRQRDIVFTRRVWEQEPCSRAGEQGDGKNRKHGLHVCELSSLCCDCSCPGGFESERQKTWQTGEEGLNN